MVRLNFNLLKLNVKNFNFFSSIYLYNIFFFSFNFYYIIKAKKKNILYKFFWYEYSYQKNLYKIFFL